VSDPRILAALGGDVRRAHLGAGAVHFKEDAAPLRELHLVERGSAILAASLGGRPVALDDLGPGVAFGGGTDALPVWIETRDAPLEALVLSEGALAALRERFPAAAADLEHARAVSGARRSRRLVEAVADALEREKMLLAHLAHDLRSPLLTLDAGLTHLLEQQEKFGALTADQGRILRRSRQCGRYLRELVEQIIDVRGGGPAATRGAAVTLAEVLVDVIPGVLGATDLALLATLPALPEFASLEAALRPRGLALDVEADLLHAPIAIDAAALKRTLANLVGNALRYAPGAVSVQARRQRGGVELAVADRGPGIPEAFRAKVFDRLARPEVLAAAVPCGTGLGLCSARELVERMGGAIRAEAGDGGVGTSIVFWVPVCDAPPGASGERDGGQRP
jgi:two-component system sensor histidine kinase KdpD